AALRAAVAGTGSVTASFFDLGKQVADASESMNFHGCARFLKLSPKTMHVDRDGVGIQFVVKSVELFLQDSLGHDAALASHQMLENRAFPASKLQYSGADPHVASDRIEFNVACMKHGAERSARTSQQRLDTCDKLCHCKRLDKVIVGTEV